jgi:antitoxin MazE
MGNANVITLRLDHLLQERGMKARVVRIGNSRGIRIPKAVIEQCHLHGAVDLEIQQGQLVIRSATKARSGWDEAFEQMHRHGDDQLLDRKSASTSTWDRKDWTW